MKHVPLFLLPLLATAATGTEPSIHCVRAECNTHFDTGVQAKTGLKIELVAEWTNVNRDCGVFGARDDSNRFFPIHVTDGRLCMGVGGTFYRLNAADPSSPYPSNVPSNPVTIDPNTVYTIVADFANDHQTITLDGVTVYSGTLANGLSLSLNCYLFAINEKGTARYHSFMKLYSAKIWMDGELVRDYRPDFRNGVAGLYDAVFKTFAPATGNVPFATVPRWTVGAPDAFVEWVGKSGSGLDTLVRARNPLAFEGKMQWTAVNAVAGGTEYNYLGAYRSKQSYMAPVHIVSNQLWFAYGNYVSDDGPHRAYLTHANDGTPVTTTAGTDHTFYSVMSNGVQSLVWDGETVHTGTLDHDVDTGDNIAVFAAGSNGGFANPAGARCYWLKIYDGDGNLVRDFVPAVKNGEGVLYDRVENRCHYAWSPMLGSSNIGPALAAPTKPVRFCEYVGADKSQYIDTGIIGHSDTKVEATIEWTTVSEDATAIGSRKGTNTRFYPIHCYNGLTYGYNNYFTVGTFVVGQKHVVVSELYAGAQKITLDGVVKAEGTQGAIDTGLTMYLYALHYGNEVKCPAKVRIYDLKIWQDGTLVRDYVPVIADNGAPYLWDKVTKTLCGSATDTPFWACGEMGESFQRPGLVIIVQ